MSDSLSQDAENLLFYELNAFDVKLGYLESLDNERYRLETGQGAIDEDVINQTLKCIPHIWYYNFPSIRKKKCDKIPLLPSNLRTFLSIRKNCPICCRFGFNKNNSQENGKTN